MPEMSWRDCSAVKSTCGSSRRPRFDSQDTHGDSQSSVKRLPWDQTPFSRHTCDALTYRQNTHTQRIIILKKSLEGCHFLSFAEETVEKAQLPGATWKKRRHLGVLLELGLEHLYPKATYAAMCGFSDTESLFNSLSTGFSMK